MAKTTTPRIGFTICGVMLKSIEPDSFLGGSLDHQKKPWLSESAYFWYENMEFSPAKPTGKMWFFLLSFQQKATVQHQYLLLQHLGIRVSGRFNWVSGAQPVKVLKSTSQQWVATRTPIFGHCETPTSCNQFDTDRMENAYPFIFLITEHLSVF